jgi:hypothetical protein
LLIGWQSERESAARAERKSKFGAGARRVIAFALARSSRVSEKAITIIKTAAMAMMIIIIRPNARAAAPASPLLYLCLIIILNGAAAFAAAAAAAAYLH